MKKFLMIVVIEYSFLTLLIFVSILIGFGTGLPHLLEKFWFRTDNTTSSCFRVPNLKLNFDASRIACIALDGDIAVMNTAEKYKNFTNFFYGKLGLDQDLSIGLKNYHTNNGRIMQRWINNASVVYTNFYPGEPNDISHSCYSIKGASGYDWYARSCLQIQYFVCEKECDYDIEYNNRTFTIQAKPQNYAQARIHCQNLQGDLAIINDAILSGIFNFYLSWVPSVWIGLNDTYNLNSLFSYLWVNNNFASTYVDWGFYEYDPKHDCVLMTSFTAGYKWKNVLCSTITWSLCERGSLKYGSATPPTAATASIQASVSKPKIYFYTTDATTKISPNSADTIYKQIQSSTAGLRTISSLNGISLNRCAVYCSMILACDEFIYKSFMVNDISENVCTILTASS